MRGVDVMQESLFTTVQLESFVPADHPIRPLREMFNTALQRISYLFDAAYAEGGRESIAPERLLRALLLQVLYGIRSERQLVEQTHYNLLFRWFVGLSIDDAVWNHSTFSKNRDRLLEHDVVPELFAEVVRMAGQRGLLSQDHFSVDGTLIQAWASHKSFRPKDGGTGGIGRNQEQDFHGEQRKNDTHASTTDPEARLYRKSFNTAAVLCYQGHTVVENRNGLVVRAQVSPATGTGERDVALELLASLPGKRRKTVGADKGYDVKAFIEGCRRLRITPHVAAKDQRGAIDQRTCRHAGYAISQIKRKRVEEPFGWMKLAAQLRQVKQRGTAQVAALFQMGMMGWNLIRMRNLLMGVVT
ncbi:MAG TPA: IS5 family transposase [Rhodanobacteraceae bacterium]|nr:IS5 family transposase [Rhodanobacteraceae bacterium]